MAAHIPTPIIPAPARLRPAAGEFRLVPGATIAFDWDPVTTVGTDHVAGVGAAVWCETVRDVDDLTFLLLPRLAGTAEKAWDRPER